MKGLKLKNFSKKITEYRLKITYYKYINNLQFTYKIQLND